MSTLNAPPPTKPFASKRFGEYCFKAVTEVDLIDDLMQRARFTGFGTEMEYVSTAVHRECIQYCKKTFRNTKKWSCSEPTVTMLTNMKGKVCHTEMFFELQGITKRLV
jgi:hypothetical protein